MGEGATFSWEDSQFELLQKHFKKSLRPLWLEYYGHDFISDNLDECSEFYGGDYGDYQIDIDKYKLSHLIEESTSELVCPISTDEALDLLTEFDLDDMAYDHYMSAEEDDRVFSTKGRGGSNVDSIFDGFIESKFS